MASILLLSQEKYCQKTIKVVIELITDAIKYAIENQNRPDADRSRDQNRKPTELLEFFNICNKKTIGEINAGRGYFSSIAAHAIEDSGFVYAHTSPMSIKRWKGNPIEKRLEEFPQNNLKAVVGEMESPNFPQEMNGVFNIMTYHDSVWTKTDRDAMNKSIFDSLTSGGIYGIIDHHAKPGHGIDDCHSIHRIEKDFVIKEVAASGFVLEEESSVLENPDDNMTLMVFEKEIRDRTSRFVLKFKKP